MKRTASHDTPFDHLSRAERRQWRSAARRVDRDHDAAQMATLQGLAATGGGVTAMVTSGPGSPLTETVEMYIDGRRLRAHQVHRPTLAALREAMSSIASLPLAAVSRYGPYWVLTFKTATEPLVVLADRLTILPEWGGGGSWVQGPSAPALHLAG